MNVQYEDLVPGMTLARRAGFDHITIFFIIAVTDKCFWYTCIDFANRFNVFDCRFHELGGSGITAIDHIVCPAG